VPTSLDQLLFILKILFTFVAALMGTLIVLSLPLQLVFPDTTVVKVLGSLIVGEETVSWDLHGTE
jgi:hypothetical protein